MSVITTVEAVPNRIRLFFDVMSEKPKGEDAEKLEAQLAPGVLRTKESAPEGEDQSPAAVYRNPLREATKLQVVTERDRKLFGPDMPKGGSDFLDWVEPRLLKKEEATKYEQSLVPYSVAWLLMQSPLKPLPFAQNYKTQIEKDYGSGYDSFDLTSKERFQNLAYWTRYLGYSAFMTDRSVVCDPTVALRRKLPVIFANNEELRVADFFGALAEEVSVFEGGSVREELESALAKVRGARVDQRLSQSTSLALVRLEAEGVLQLRELSDAAVKILDLGDGQRRVSHLGRGARA